MMEPGKATEPPRLRRLGWIALAIGLLLVAVRLWIMFRVPLMDTTEARYGDIGRRMLESGNLVTPWFNDNVPFWGKPPLSFWLTATSFALFGVSEFSARLPHLLCSVAVIGLVWLLARRRSRHEAVIAIMLLGGCIGMFIGSAGVMTDPSLMLGTTLAMTGFWIAVSDTHATHRLGGQVMLFVGLAIGLLAKGPLAIVLAAPPLLGWALLSRRIAQTWRSIPWVRGMLFTLALAAPWYVLAEIRTPGFLEYFLLGEHIQRFLTPGWRGDLYGSAHREPLGMIWAFGLAAVLPWPLLFAFRRGPVQPPAAEAAPWRLYLLLWALWPLVFFTAARNIIWPYVLPALPAAALLAAEWIARLDPRMAMRRLCAGLMLVSVAAAVALSVEGWGDERSTRDVVAEWHQRRSPAQPLIFVGRRPFSASFYGRGEPGSAPSVQAALDSAGPGGFVAAEARYLDKEIADTVRQGRAVVVGGFGRFTLLRVSASVGR